MATNTVGYAGFIAVAAVVALLSSDLLATHQWAGLPGAVGTLGTATAAIVLAGRSKRLGRRIGIRLGYTVGVGGALLAFVAGQIGAFWVLVLAMGLFGIGHAANLQNRFAAADLARDDERARAISIVVWVETLGAVLGPAAALWANRVGVDFGLEEWAAPFLLGVIGFAAAGLMIHLFLRPDPLELAGGVDPNSSRPNPLRDMDHSWRVIWPNHQARLAIGALAVSQMAMVAVMTMTPLHMKDHGHAELSTIVIAVHVLGMFGLSPLTGKWADDYGRVRALRVGAVILGLGTVSAVAAGYVPVLMFVGLFLLGLGWSFAMIAGSALLTESVPSEERVGAQGLSDVMMSGLGAAAAFGSGFVKVAVGFHWLANFATIAAVVVFVAALAVSRDQRVVV